MKFRTHIAIALGTTALVPFLAWTLFQTSDIDGKVSEADHVQERAGHAVRWLIEDRLKTIGHLSAFAAKALEASPAKDYEMILREMVVGFPLIDNLHVDCLTTDGADGTVGTARVAAFYPPKSQAGDALVGADHTGRWHVEAERRGLTDEIVFSPVLLASQTGSAKQPILTFALSIENAAERADRPSFHAHPHKQLLLSGAISVKNLLADVEKTLQGRGYELTILTQDGQVLWPLSETQLKTWPEIPKDGTVVGLGRAARFATVLTLQAPAPDWTVVVSRPQTLRNAERSTLHFRAGMIGLLLVILTTGVALMTARPITRALKLMTEDIEGGNADREATTVRRGPAELRRFQLSYRKVKDSLDTKNEELRRVLDRRSRQLMAEEMLFRAVFESLSFPCLLLDEAWTPRHANKAGERLVPEVVSALVSAAKNRLQATDDSGDNFAEVRTSEGRTLVFGMRVLPFAARRSSLSRGFVLLVEDVTERENLARMKQDLISIVAHELKTPITACRLQVDRMTETYGKKPEFDDLADDLAHLTRIVNDWLAIAKIDGGTFTVSPEVIQLDPIIRRARRLVRARHDFDFTLSLDEDAECIRADAGALTEVFVNLFTNACRYAKPGEKPHIEVDVRREAVKEKKEAATPTSDTVIITVTDHGIGIPKAHLERVFDRFYQVATGNKRKTGGTGLGLVITRAVVEAHGGTITATSGSDGEGKEGAESRTSTTSTTSTTFTTFTTFTIRLPQEAQA